MEGIEFQSVISCIQQHKFVSIISRLHHWLVERFPLIKFTFDGVTKVQVGRSFHGLWHDLKFKEGGIGDKNNYRSKRILVWNSDYKAGSRMPSVVGLISGLIYSDEHANIIRTRHPPRHFGKYCGFINSPIRNVINSSPHSCVISRDRSREWSPHKSPFQRSGNNINTCWWTYWFQLIRVFFFF
jgi:hypothetical protein